QYPDSTHTSPIGINPLRPTDKLLHFRRKWTDLVPDDARLSSSLIRKRAGGGAGGGRERGGDAGQLFLAVGGGGEPGLKRRRRQVHAAVQHGVEERRVGGGGLVLGVGEVGHRVGAADEDGEQTAGGRQVVRYPDGGELGRDQLRERARERVDRGVHLGRAGAQ